MLAKGFFQELDWCMKEAVTELTWEDIQCAVAGSARESYRIAAIHPNKWQEGELSRHAGLHVFESQCGNWHYLLGAIHDHAIERPFRAAGNFFDYELRFLSVAMRDVVSKKLLETVEGGLAELMILVKRPTAGVQCNSFLYMKSSGRMSGF